MSLALLILTGIVGLALGIWLGMPGRYRQTPEEIERIMESGGGRRRKTKRIFTPLAWMQRKASSKSGPSRERRKSRGQRRGFSLESPEERKERDDDNRGSRRGSTRRGFNLQSPEERDR